MKIALSMIVGDGAGKDFERALVSAAPYVDGIYVTFTGKKGPSPELLRIGKDHGVNWSSFKWIDDFGAARNFALSQVPRDEYDWFLWMDSDDTLEVQEGHTLHSIIDTLKPDTRGVFARYDYAIDPVTLNATVEQWRERLLRLDGDWVWRYPIHEVCHGRPGTQYARKGEFFIRHWRSVDKANDDRETRARNRRIISKALQQWPDESRFIYYLANELYADIAHQVQTGADLPVSVKESQLRAAIKQYRRFIEETTFQDDAYVANCNMAECYRLMDDHNRAIDCDLQGVKLFPSWPTAYVGIAKSCMAIDDWEKCRHWANVCLEYGGDPQTTQVFEPLNLDVVPLTLRSLGAEKMGDFDAAIADAKKLVELQPHNERFVERLAMLEAMAEVAASGADKKDIGNWRTVRETRKGLKPQRSIAFLTRPLFEPWHPALEASGGAGGAETCIMRLAPKFREDNWRVVVFGTPGDHAGIDADGVEWYPASDWDSSEKFTVMVSSRAPEVFDSYINADAKFLWMHDVNSGPEFDEGSWGSRVPAIDRIVGLTQWHARHLGRLYPAVANTGQLCVIPNGINLDLYPKTPPKARTGENRHRFVWSNSPDRGLDVVLQMWSQIKEEWPDAQLDIFYGWTAIDKIIAQGGNARYLIDFKANVEGLVELAGGASAGINWRDRVPQSVLAQEQAKMAYWLYPTYFMETFCITALEMQAAGVIPITSDLAALRETVASRELTLDGWPNNFTYRAQYMELLRSVVNAPAQAQDRWRTLGWRHAQSFSWAEAYRAWQYEISSVMAQKGITV